MNWTIEISCMILLTSFTGSIFFLAWYAAGRCLEKAGYVRAKYGLLKIVVVSFFLPVSYVFLKSKVIISINKQQHKIIFVGRRKPG